MRKQTEDDLRKIRSERDMLTGNINRMNLTDSLAELDKMKDFAIKRINIIYQVNYDRLTQTDADVAPDYRCSCGNKTFFVKKKNIHYGLYCKLCGAWKKWLNEDEKHLIGIKWQEVK